MIWVIGGTKDSREFIERAPLKERLIVTTATEYGGKLLDGIDKIEVISKALTLEEMDIFVKENKIDMIVDLSHPYAVEVSKNAIEISKKNKIEYIRYEREVVEIDGIIEFKNIEDMINYIDSSEKRVLSTIGGNNIAKFKNMRYLSNVYFRVLPKSEILKKMEECGILAKNIIAMQGPFSKELNIALIKQLNINCLITKKSGDTGGEREKIEASKETGIELLYLTKDEIQYPKVYYEMDKLINDIFCI